MVMSIMARNRADCRSLETALGLDRSRGLSDQKPNRKNGHRGALHWLYSVLILRLDARQSNLQTPEHKQDKKHDHNRANYTTTEIHFMLLPDC